MIRIKPDALTSLDDLVPVARTKPDALTSLDDLDSPINGGGQPPAAHGWRAQALCAQTDPDLFYPETGQTSRTARTVCDTCPVTAECLAYALAQPEPHGVWGGLSARERTLLRRRQGSG